MGTATVCECGWTSKPSTPARADYAFTRHSCGKHQRQAEIHARGIARMAAVDRTPKPCLHKQASHRHGTYACYTLDGCRCPPCAAAQSHYEKQRIKQHAYGRWDHYVDAEPARRWVHWLQLNNVGLKRIARLTGVSQGSLWKLMYGKRRPDGSQVPSVRITAATEAKLLALQPSLDILGRTVKVDGTGTRRRLQALVACGWTISRVGAELGMTPGNIHRTIGSELVQAQTARKARHVYDRLWNAPPPESTHRQRIVASRARNYAQAHGWPPPLAWDDDTIDDPTAKPQHDHDDPSAGVDHAAVERRIAGDTTVSLTRSERWTVVRRLNSRGLNDAEIERLTGIGIRQVERDRQTLGLPQRSGAAA